MQELLEQVVIKAIENELNVSEVRPKKGLAHESYINIKLNGEKTSAITIVGFEKKFDNADFILLKLKKAGKIHVIDRFTTVAEIANHLKAA